MNSQENVHNHTIETNESINSYITPDLIRVNDEYIFFLKNDFDFINIYGNYYLKTDELSVPKDICKLILKYIAGNIVKICNFGMFSDVDFDYKIQSDQDSTEKLKNNVQLLQSHFTQEAYFVTSTLTSNIKNKLNNLNNVNPVKISIKQNEIRCFRLYFNLKEINTTYRVTRNRRRYRRKYQYKYISLFFGFDLINNE